MADLPGKIPHINNDVSLSLSELVKRWRISEEGVVQELRDGELTCAQFSNENIGKYREYVINKFKIELSKIDPRLAQPYEKNKEYFFGKPEFIQCIDPPWHKLYAKLNNPKYRQFLRFRLEQDVWPVEERIPERKAAAREHYQFHRTQDTDLANKKDHASENKGLTPAMQRDIAAYFSKLRGLTVKETSMLIFPGEDPKAMEQQVKNARSMGKKRYEQWVSMNEE